MDVVFSTELFESFSCFITALFILRFFCHEFDYLLGCSIEQQEVFSSVRHYLSVKKRYTQRLLPTAGMVVLMKPSFLDHSCSLFCIQFDFMNHSLSQRLVIRFRDVGTKQQVYSLIYDRIRARGSGSTSN